jgi:hypothetical protein
VDEEERLPELIDFAGAEELWRERRDGPDERRVLASLDDDGRAEAVTDEDGIGAADALEEGAGGKDIEDALVEDVGVPVVDAEHTDASRRERNGKGGIEPAGRAIEPAHRATDANQCAGTTFDGGEDAFNIAAVGLEKDADGARLFRFGGADAEEPEAELFFVAVPGELFGVHVVTIRPRRERKPTGW